MIVNLLGNAIKYTLRGEINVKIEVDEKRKKCYFIIADTGVGISAEVQKNFFKNFSEKRKKKQLIFQELARSLNL